MLNSVRCRMLGEAATAPCVEPKSLAAVTQGRPSLPTAPPREAGCCCQHRGDWDEAAGWHTEQQAAENQSRSWRNCRHPPSSRATSLLPRSYSPATSRWSNLGLSDSPTQCNSHTSKTGAWFCSLLPVLFINPWWHGRGPAPQFLARKESHARGRGGRVCLLCNGTRTAGIHRPSPWVGLSV